MKINRINVEIPTMKSSITILALAALTATAVASTAQAGTYSRAAKVQEYCSLQGEWTREIHATGMINGLAKSDIDPKIMGKEYKGIMALFNLVEKDKPRSSHAAYMLGWATCMDKYN